MFVDLNLYLPGDLFMLLDKMTMAVSLEARVPLLDHRLVEFVSALPGRLRMRGNDLKWLLKNALRGHLPDTLLDRPKQGFGPPLNQWLTGPLRPIFLRLLTGKTTRLLNLFTKQGLKSWVDLEEQRPGGASMKIWALLVLELWWRVFMENIDFTHVSLQEIVENESVRWI
jgi:asparagine synthase (glutamine-hydrolysing)